MKIITKRITLYVIGLFLLSPGVSFSIQTSLGVSPVSSLAYAITLTAGLSIGITTVIANVLFIVVQIFLNKRVELREFTVQLIVVFLFGFFMDVTLFLVQLLPTPESFISKIIVLSISFYIISAALLFYFTAKLPLMPYDALTYVISERFKFTFSKAKITSDMLNVVIAAVICLIFIQSFGSVGIGTILAAYFVGKILGKLIPRFQQPLQQWIYRGKTDLTVEERELLKPFKK